MTTTTDVNSMIFHSSTRMNEEISNSFMDIDDPPVNNEHSSSIHQNGISDDKDNIFHQG
jgi:hypothetical protein